MTGRNRYKPLLKRSGPSPAARSGALDGDSPDTSLRSTPAQNAGSAPVQNDDVDAGVLVRPEDGVPERVSHRPAQRVSSVGPVERHGRDAILDVEPDNRLRFGHWYLRRQRVRTTALRIITGRPSLPAARKAPLLATAVLALILQERGPTPCWVWSSQCAASKPYATSGGELAAVALLGLGILLCTRPTPRRDRGPMRPPRSEDSNPRTAMNRSILAGLICGTDETGGT